MTKTLIDSSYLYALYNSGDKNHSRALNFARTTSTSPIVPEIILTEVTFLFLRDIGHHGVSRFLEKFVAIDVELQSILKQALQRAHEIMVTYASAEFDFVDWCIMALAERLQVNQICTFDRRDFMIFRPTHCDYL